MRSPRVHKQPLQRGYNSCLLLGGCQQGVKHYGKSFLYLPQQVSLSVHLSHRTVWKHWVTVAKTSMKARAIAFTSRKRCCRISVKPGASGCLKSFTERLEVLPKPYQGKGPSKVWAAWALPNALPPDFHFIFVWLLSIEIDMPEEIFNWNDA